MNENERLERVRKKLDKVVGEYGTMKFEKPLNQLIANPF